jgi:hypothetical protein
MMSVLGKWGIELENSECRILSIGCYNLLWSRLRSSHAGIFLYLWHRFTQMISFNSFELSQHEQLVFLENAFIFQNLFQKSNYSSSNNSLKKRLLFPVQKGVQTNMLRGKIIFSFMSFRTSLRLAKWKKHIMPIQLKYHIYSHSRLCLRQTSKKRRLSSYIKPMRTLDSRRSLFSNNEMSLCLRLGQC